jgi:hypothetical protein
VYLTDLPDILTWQEPSSLLDRLQIQYQALLFARLNALITRIVLPTNVDLRVYFADAMEELSGLEQNSLLCEPEISFRLLWPSHHSDVEAALFLAHVLNTRGNTIRADRFCLDGLQLDAASPLARTVDISGNLPRRLSDGPVYDANSLMAVIAKAEVANRLIRNVVPNAWTVVANFTKLLHFLPDYDAPSQFSSGSSGQFVGRTVIANAHLEKITAIELSEALVHEAIHAVLYMAEQQRPWVLDPDLYAGPARIASPWTHNPLPLRPYLQACFVWYGLACYLTGLLQAEGTNDILIKQRLEIALSGFRRLDLLANIAPFLNDLSDEVKSAIDVLQSRIRAWVGKELCA